MPKTRNSPAVKAKKSTANYSVLISEIERELKRNYKPHFMKRNLLKSIAELTTPRQTLAYDKFRSEVMDGLLHVYSQGKLDGVRVSARFQLFDELFDKLISLNHYYKIASGAVNDVVMLHQEANEADKIIDVKDMTKSEAAKQARKLLSTELDLFFIEEGDYFLRKMRLKQYLKKIKGE